jgi:hypothetical protein
VNLSELVGKLADTLVKERSLDREEVIPILCDSVCIAHEEQFPGYRFIVSHSKDGRTEVFVEKQVVAIVKDDVKEILLEKAKAIDLSAKLGDTVNVPFEEKVEYIELLPAEQIESLVYLNRRLKEL